MKLPKFWLSVVLMTTLISGCVRGHSDGGLVLAKNYCPALVRYSKQDQLALAEELKKLPPGLAKQFINDYSKLRDICRKIKMGKK